MSYASQKTQVAFSPDTLAQSLPGKAEMSFHSQLPCWIQSMVSLPLLLVTVIVFVYLFFS